MAEELEEMRVRLPRHLAIWLEEFSKTIAREPSQFLANILQQYFEIWKIGADGSYTYELFENSLKTKSARLTKSLLEEFLQVNKSVNKSLLWCFISWTRERGLRVNDIDESVVEKFLEEYRSRRAVKPRTLRLYKFWLRKFVGFIKTSK